MNLIGNGFETADMLMVQCVPVVSVVSFLPVVMHCHLYAVVEERLNQVTSQDMKINISTA